MTIVDRQFSRNALKIYGKLALLSQVFGDHLWSTYRALIFKRSSCAVVRGGTLPGVVDRQFHHKPFELTAKQELAHG